MRARGVCLGAALWLLCLCGRAAALPPATWLVVIGSNLGAAGELELRYAERDAQQLAEVLRQQGEVASRHTTVLLGEDAGTVRRALLDLNARIRGQISPGGASALIVFYSGHADASALHLRGTELPFEELKELVEGSAAAVRLLIVDACRSGSITRVKGVTPAPSFQIQREDPSLTEGMAIITSSAAGESSQESDRLRGSFFTHHMVNALRGAADHNGDGRITLSETYAYTYNQTLRSSGGTVELQHPTYSFDVKGREDLVLAVSARTGGRSGRLLFAGAALYLISEEREGGAVVAEVNPAQARGALLLPPGDYFIQQRWPQEYHEFQIRLPPAGEVDLARQPYRTVHYDRLVRRRGSSRSASQGATLLFGARGPLLTGESPAPQVLAGYGIDLPWLTLGGRVRAGLSGVTSSDGLLRSQHAEIAAGVLIQRFIDLQRFSLSFAIWMESVYHRQVFQSQRSAPPRNAWGFGFGGLFAAEVPLWRGLSLRAEAGPLTELFPQAVSQDGAQQVQRVDSAFTYWAAAGLVLRR